ncbi:MAG TPA: hypothetical protein VH062_36600 [Polyangiaceae bacterium]|nr:hypothetical protein [Polyangiaceae bacterium]
MGALEIGCSGSSNPSAAMGVGGSTMTTQSSGGSGAVGGGNSVSPSGPFPAVTDLTKDGPFTSQTIMNTGPNGNYTVYAPSPLAPGGVKDPIVGWMSGGGTVPSNYPLLPRLATHGFFVVASNTAPDIGAEVELGQEILAGIDWALAENGRQGSVFAGTLDPSKIASMGYSMGSLATFTIANDPRLTTTVHVSGGNMDSSRIANLHAPAAFFCGITGDASCNILDMTCDIAAANCDTDFMNATTPVFYGKFPGGHLGILQEPNQDRIYSAVIGWLRWKLMGDTTRASMFVGTGCTLCTDPNWKVQEKSIQ